MKNKLEPSQLNENNMDETDSKESDVKYVQPKNIEITLSKEKRQACREIVKEINNFGVSQRQKIFICELLALELENQDVRDAFTDAVKLARTKLGNEIEVVSMPKKKLIV